MRYCAVLGGTRYCAVLHVLQPLCGAGRAGQRCVCIRRAGPEPSAGPAATRANKISDDRSSCCTKACTVARTDLRGNRPARLRLRCAAVAARSTVRSDQGRAFMCQKPGLSLVRHRMRCARAHVRARARGAPPKEILLDEPNLLRAQRADRLVEISAPRPRVGRSWRACAHHNHESQGRSPATRRVCARA
jgi:hypothetical protein